jgi:hypothetical protein
VDQGNKTSSSISVRKAITSIALLFAFGCSKTDSVPSPELQTRLATQLGLQFQPRDPRREASGYWHFWGFYGTYGTEELTVDVPAGSSFDQIKDLATAKYRIKHPTPEATK